uniref:Transposase n=1 Tax=Denticeps clupeoides TaxID=299321 RepID=A0AAY4DTF1_9TELE
MLGRKWVFQMDNDPKHTAKLVTKWLKDNKVNVLEDLKMAVHQRFSSNLPELERICKEEWQRIPKSRCEKPVAFFPKRLMAVIL